MINKKIIELYLFLIINNKDELSTVSLKLPSGTMYKYYYDSMPPKNNFVTCLFNLDAEYIMRNAGLDEAQAGTKTAGRNINSLR